MQNGRDLGARTADFVAVESSDANEDPQAILASIAVPPLAIENDRMQGGWVYIVTNRPNGTLYLGVTSDLARRAGEHREGLVEGFTSRYGLERLVYPSATRISVPRFIARRSSSTGRARGRFG